MGAFVGGYIGATIGIHSPIPYSAPDRLGLEGICIIIGFRRVCAWGVIPQGSCTFVVYTYVGTASRPKYILHGNMEPWALPKVVRKSGLEGSGA